MEGERFATWVGPRLRRTGGLSKGLSKLRLFFPVFHRDHLINQTIHLPDHVF
jgi:hypothetical protein